MIGYSLLLVSLLVFQVLEVKSYDWTEIYASDYADDDRFGRSVAISDELVIVGAYGNDDEGSGSGSAYIFAKDSVSGDWNQEEKLLPHDGDSLDYFGRAVDISGNVAIIGSRNDDDVGSNAGAAYIFTKDTTSGEWSQTAKLLANDASATYCGYSVSISGDSAIMGCYTSTSLVISFLNDFC